MPAMPHNTSRDTVKLLIKSIINRLENAKAIEFSAETRGKVVDDVEALVGPSIKTEQDLKEATLQQLGGRSDMVEDTGLTESFQYKSARKMIRSSFGDNELNGLYFQKTLKDIAGDIVQYMMQSDTIDEVYESDADLEKQIVAIVRRFKPQDLH